MREEVVEIEELRELPLDERRMARGGEGALLLLVAGLGGVDLTSGLFSSAGLALTSSGARKL